MNNCLQLSFLSDDRRYALPKKYGGESSFNVLSLYLYLNCSYSGNPRGTNTFTVLWCWRWWHSSTVKWWRNPISTYEQWYLWSGENWWTVSSHGSSPSNRWCHHGGSYSQTVGLLWRGWRYCAKVRKCMCMFSLILCQITCLPEALNGRAKKQEQQQQQQNEWAPTPVPIPVATVK